MAGHIEHVAALLVAVIRPDEPVGPVVMIAVMGRVAAAGKALPDAPVYAGDVAVVIAPAIITELHGKGMAGAVYVVDGREPATDVVAVGDFPCGV